MKTRKISKYISFWGEPSVLLSLPCLLLGIGVAAWMVYAWYPPIYLLNLLYLLFIWPFYLRYLMDWESRFLSVMVWLFAGITGIFALAGGADLAYSFAIAGSVPFLTILVAWLLWSPIAYFMRLRKFKNRLHLRQCIDGHETVAGIEYESDGIHFWNNECTCKCGHKIIDGKAHDWNGCKCRRCGITRDIDEHDWIGYKCRKCGKERNWCCEEHNEEHIWIGFCKCLRCKATRHVWVYTGTTGSNSAPPLPDINFCPTEYNNYRCERCGETRFEVKK